MSREDRALRKIIAQTVKNKKRELRELAGREEVYNYAEGVDLAGDRVGWLVTKQALYVLPEAVSALATRYPKSDVEHPNYFALVDGEPASWGPDGFVGFKVKAGDQEIYFVGDLYITLYEAVYALHKGTHPLL